MPFLPLENMTFITGLLPRCMLIKLHSEPPRRPQSAAARACQGYLLDRKIVVIGRSCGLCISMIRCRLPSIQTDGCCHHQHKLTMRRSGRRRVCAPCLQSDERRVGGGVRSCSSARWIPLKYVKQLINDSNHENCRPKSLWVLHPGRSLSSFCLR